MQPARVVARSGTCRFLRRRTQGENTRGSRIASFHLTSIANRTNGAETQSRYARAPIYELNRAEAGEAPFRRLLASNEDVG
jgi:hypothetical protein